MTASLPTALVTGASRGIGRAIALRLANSHEILAVARSTTELDTLASEIDARGGRCRPIALDVTDGDAVARTLGGQAVDVLVNNAGVGALKPFLELAPEEWRRMVDVNLNALYHVTRAVLPGMVERGRGDVVNIGSIAGRSAFVGGSCYAATKWAVMAFTESLMLEVRDAGVRVSVVMPGSVATHFGSGQAKDWNLLPEDVAESVAHIVAAPPEVLIHRLEVRALSPKRPRRR
ncbi:short-chain dehydrogenase/reductase SDR [Gemmatirosa kalamazoonensis]|uniref:Short-chain dehydrogenase/reductase SDR n=1 Tax=Gemmatirosa kalamazoonensis TaxID=861299 RepID=W0RIT8_9BACT|nr:SDR family oxidoreductase [Gemmatirosa kalamazoonensis]AHG90352.1 short-chain dehydrogenase/reductase SDR [Gemmatirosa kalamazoonensis]